MTRTPRKNGKSVSSTKMLQFIIREVRLLQSELRHDIRALDEKQSNRIDGLESKVDGIGSQLKDLQLKVDLNYVTFITNQVDMEKRIKVLETSRH
ncbi:MAG: hypothetical protein HOO67_00005 [Candidatus Peribacteraceae bacterium]|nr:hypothetical protein [Candidatus Peribacteraceae bacterium]